MLRLLLIWCLVPSKMCTNRSLTAETERGGGILLYSWKFKSILQGYQIKEGENTNTLGI